MSDRQRELLQLLKTHGDVSCGFLADQIECPQASVRRDIQALRRDGWTIAIGAGGNYVYTAPHQWGSVQAVKGSDVDTTAV